MSFLLCRKNLSYKTVRNNDYFVKKMQDFLNILLLSKERGDILSWILY